MCGRVPHNQSDAWWRRDGASVLHNAGMVSTDIESGRLEVVPCPRIHTCVPGSAVGLSPTWSGDESADEAGGEEGDY